MKIIRYVISIVLGLSLIVPFTIDINAANVGTYDFYLNEPSIVEGTGYFTVLLKDKTTGEYSVNVFQFYTSSSTNYDGVNNGNFIDLTLNNNSLTVYFNANVNTVTRGTLFWWKENKLEADIVTVNANATSASVTKNFPNHNIVGCQVFGNIGHVYNNLSTNHIYSVNWNGSQDYSSDIDILKNYLLDSNTQLTSISTELNNIRWLVYTINENLDKHNNMIEEFFTNGLENILSKFFGQKEENVNDMNKSELDDKTNELNNIESEIVGEFENNISKIELNNDLFKGNDFVKTSTFIATQMTNIYNSNENVKNLITFSMIIGLALTIVGIGLRR